MELHSLIDLLLHFDAHLAQFVSAYGPWVYALLLGIVFVETGLVIMPFLPGDSMLFVAGAFAASGAMSLPAVMGALWLGAVLGDSLNYQIGKTLGHRVFTWEDSRWFNRRAFDKAHAFYEKYGGITIVAARFMPFIRTFAPFVAGVAEMSYRKFVAYNIVGATLWVGLLVPAGYLFGNIPWIKHNLGLMTLGIIVLSLLPAAWGWWRSRQQVSAA
jgi:membrane-associated protein